MSEQVWTTHVEPMTDARLAHLVRVAQCLRYNEPMGLTWREFISLKERFPAAKPDPRDISPRSPIDVFYAHRVVLIPERDIAA